MTVRPYLLAFPAIIPAILLSCAPNTSSAPAAKTPQVVTVLAAASTTEALEEVARQFEARQGCKVRLSFGGSSALARQVEQGADADLFLSASVEWADYVERLGLAARRRDLLSNRLVLVVLADSPHSVTKPDDLLAPAVEHLALADPDAVPAGKYARKALTELGLWEKLQSKVASADDVRHALMLVEAGAAEAGIVYATDASLSKKLRTVYTFDEALTGPVRYPLVLLHAGERNDAARALYDTLAAPASAEVFRRYGFDTDVGWVERSEPHQNQELKADSH